MRSRQQIQAMLDEQAQQWQSCHFERLLVRAWLLSPVAHDVIGHMPLDGLLEVATLRLLRIAIDELGDIHPAPMRIPIPVQKVEVQGVEVYACSWARPHEATRLVTRKKRKHYNPSRFTRTDRVVDTQSGAYRSYDLPTAAVATPYLEWTLDADRAQLRRLLPLLVSLGKDRNSGLGTVLTWEVDTTDRDPLVHEGVPQRQLPCLDGDMSSYAPDSAALRLCPPRPPYIWHGADCQCAIPVGAP